MDDYSYNNIYKSIINSFSDFINIELNKKYYLYGETIEGNINFNNTNNIKVNDFSINLYKKESWFVQETAEVYYGEKDNQLLCKFNIDIKPDLNNNGILIPGKYVFPFKIKLPDDIEPSFEYPYPNRYSYLRYSLICESNPNIPELKHQKFILIKSLSNNILLQKSYNSIVNVHKWGFLDGGTTSLNVSYEKSNYQINNLIPLNIYIDNSRGKLKVKECKIRLIRTIQFSKLNGIEKFPLEKTINSKIFPAEVFPSDKKYFLFQIKVSDADLYDFKYIKEEKPYPNINDLNILLPTMNSTIIKCDYRIQVSLYFDNFVTSGYRPRVKLPIIISHFSEDGDNNINNINMKRNNGMNENYNYNNNLIDSNNIINKSSLIYDNNYINSNDRNNLINNNPNISNENMNKIQDNFKNSDLSEYIKSNKFENQNKSENDNNINIKPNYIELKKEYYYNINEI